MKIIESESDFDRLQNSAVLTIGNFDGVHLGHKEILAVGRNAAQQRQTELIAMTFEPHPVALLRPQTAPGVLTPLELKEHLLSKTGVDSLIVLKDSKELLELTPEKFVQRFLLEHIKPAIVVEGDDFNFGAQRAGNIETLKKLGAEKGFEVIVVKPKQIKLSENQILRVSSTMIRYMLESGHISDANIALDRPYRLIEEIIPGRGVGRKLGFPTLNLKIPKQVIPAEGVYAGFVNISDNCSDVISAVCTIPAVYSIGQARTYGDDFPLLIEAHLLISDSDCPKGKYMAMDFIKHIRSQHKFKTPEKLSEQIAKDCETARRFLKLQD